MWIFRVQVNDKHGSWGSYAGLARNVGEASTKAKRKAKREGCKAPIVVAVKREELASW